MIRTGLPFTPGQWVIPEVAKFRIRLTKDWRCDIAGRRIFFRGGEDYWDVADVKRILAEAGLLDPVCIREKDSGLTDEEVERLGKNRPLRWAIEGDPDFSKWHAGV